MSKKKHLSLRFTSALLCMTILTGGMAANWTPIRDIPVSAKTLAELQEERKSNEKKIAEKQKELDSLQSDLEEKEAYQKTLQEKITLQQSNLDIVSQELDRIAQSIDETTQAISQAEDDIKVMEADIAIGLDEFKMRLRAMYVQGNDSLASALVGATDFYDLLSKYELMSRVANHDNQLVNDLKDKLETCNAKKAELETEKSDLESQQEDQQAKKEEFKAAIEDLQQTYSETDEAKEQMQRQKEQLNGDVATLEENNKALDAEEDQIKAAIAAAAEAEKKKREEAAAAEEAKKKLEAQNFGIRKNVLQFDDVMNKQREIIYGQRRKVLNGEDLSATVRTMMDENIAASVESFCAGENPADWDFAALRRHYQGWLTRPTDFVYPEEELKGITRDKVAQVLQERGAASGHRPCKLHVSLTIIDPEESKTLAQQLMEEAGVEVLMYVFCTDVIREGNEVKGVVIESKAGREAILARTVIDCTGDADVAFRAGVECRKGDAEGGMQPPTLMFSMRGVATQRLRDAIAEHPDIYDMDIMPAESFRNEKFITVGLRNQIAKAREAGIDLPVARTILITGMSEDEIWVNMSRVNGVDPTDPGSYTRGEIEARKQVYRIRKYLRQFVPGFENAWMDRVAPFMGIRESRVTVGKYVLTAEDIIACRRFGDAIAVAGYPVDIHHAKGGDCTLYWCDDCYDIPYRTLIPAHVGNLLVAGRCSSMNHEAMASTRVMSTCMALGEAAGRAARLALKAGVQPADLDVEALRAELRATGAYLG